MSEPGAALRDEGARLLQAGDLTSALQRLQQAVQQTPGDARAHTYLGICKTRLGDPAGGIQSLQESVRLAPADAVFRYNLGVALSQAGRGDEAKAELAEAMRLNPNHAGARELLHRLQAAPAGAAAAPPAAPFPPPPTPQPLIGEAAAFAWTSPTPGAAPPPAPSAPLGWSPPTPPVGQQPPTPAGVWSPAPIPGQSPGGWAPPSGPTAPLGDPSAGWSPAAPGAGPQQQQGEYTGSPAAMYYAQDQAAGGQPPSVALRLVRGLGWGIIYGQWWTLWTIFSAFLWGGASLGSSIVLRAIVYGIAYGFFGSLVGLIIAAANLDEDQAVYAGVGAGVVILGLELVIFKSPTMLFNVFFYFFTGR
ncbi:MAG: repeat-containing protein, partial [Armatimonadetes bacterium]|nr:repeat-containing protein [Armatimonadota bacterium]